MEQKIEEISVKDLHLWTENPRQPVNVSLSDEDVIKIALTDSKKKWDLQKLTKQMGSYYDLSELPTVVKTDGKYVVYDGNRRIAVLKYLQNKELFQNLGGGLFYNEEPIELKKLVKISCNVCDKETALNNVERKHIDSGSWGELERHYFLFMHRQEAKSPFLIVEESTGIISENEKMNQRFVNEEVLTIENLKKIGFSIDKERLISNYTEDISKNILKNIVQLINLKTITTRKNRHKLKEQLLKFKELENVIKDFNPNESFIECFKNNQPVKLNNSRRTPKTLPKEKIFGKELHLKKGNVNDLYLAITKIYEKNENDHTVLPIVGMSLRLILEVAGRVVLRETDDPNKDTDNAYRVFLKKVKEKLKQEDLNFTSTTSNWLNGTEKLEAVLGKYAHGSMPIEKGNILQQSIIVGEILEIYFKKDKR